MIRTTTDNGRSSGGFRLWTAGLKLVRNTQSRLRGSCERLLPNLASQVTTRVTEGYGVPLCMCAVLVSASGQADPLTKYKNFLENPPPIRSMIVQVSKDGHNNFFEFRYQSNAFRVLHATNVANLQAEVYRPGREGEVEAFAAGRMNEVFWSITSKQSFVIDKLSAGTLQKYASSNRYPVRVDTKLFSASHIMNMGLPASKIGSLKWTGNTVRGTNWFGKPFSAEVFVDERGRPARIEANLYDSEDGSSSPFWVEYEYDSDGRLPGWELPAVIRHKSSFRKILAVELADGPQPLRRFHYAPFINRGSNIESINTYRDQEKLGWENYDDLKHGWTKFFGMWVPKSSLRPWFFTLTAVLTAGAVILAWASIRKQKQVGS